MKKTTETLVATVNEREALEKVREHEKEALAITQAAGKVRIEDADDYKVACSLLIDVAVKRKYVDEQRQAFMADVVKLVDRVNGWFVSPLEKLNDAERTFRDALAEYALALDTKALSLRKAAASAKDEAKAVGLLEEANTYAPPKHPGVAIVTQTKVTVVDEEKLPDWAWKRVVDNKSIEAAIARGESVPGVVSTVTKSVRVTPKNAKE